MDALRLADNDNGATRVQVPRRQAGEPDPVRIYLDGFASPNSKATMLQAFARLATLTDAYGAASAQFRAPDRVSQCARTAHELSQEAIEAIAWHRLDFERTNTLRALLMEQYTSPATVEITLCALRGLLRTCFKMGLMTHEQLARATSWGKVQGSRLPRGRALAPEEVQIIASWCRVQGGVYGAFVRATFAILIGVGMRADQLCTLPMSAYLQGQRSLRSVGKGNKEHLVPLGDQEAASIESWLKCRPTEIWEHGARGGERLPAGEALLLSIVPSRVTSTPYFAKAMTKDSLRGLCTRVAEECGLPHFTPHDLRRTFATRLLTEGLDLAVVQRLMCHAFPSTTVRYDMRSRDSDAAARRRVVLWLV